MAYANMSFTQEKPAPHAGYLNDAWSQLSAQAKQGTKIDQTDPNFRQQADSYAAGVERSRRNAVADNAEAMDSQMIGGSGAQAVANRGINEAAQQQQGGFEAQLVARELTNRRSEIQNALGLMMQNGNQEQQRELTRQLGLIDAQLRAAGLDVQESGIASGERQNNSNLGFNYTQLETNANRDAMLAALGGQ